MLNIIATHSYKLPLTPEEQHVVSCLYGLATQSVNTHTYTHHKLLYIVVPLIVEVNSSLVLLIRTGVGCYRYRRSRKDVA